VSASLPEVAYTSTALQDYRRDQGNYGIDQISVFGYFCIMRIHDNTRPLNGHGGEVEFGYSRESAWLLTETTITWRGRTEAWWSARQRRVPRRQYNPVKTHHQSRYQIRILIALAAQQLCQIRPCHGKPARGDSDSLDTTHRDGETVTTPADFATRLPDLHNVHSAHNHLTCTPWPVDRKMCWILLWGAALRQHRPP